jgi:hypothetical protein
MRLADVTIRLQLAAEVHQACVWQPQYYASGMRLDRQ